MKTVKAKIKATGEEVSVFLAPFQHDVWIEDAVAYREFNGEELDFESL